MCNVKNIQNLMILRQIAFQIYSPLAMKSQNIIIFTSFVFGGAFLVLFNSVYEPGSSIGYFYKLYSPNEIWWYLTMFSITYFIPCTATLFALFWYEMQINTWMDIQAAKWKSQ